MWRSLSDDTGGDVCYAYLVKKDYIKGFTPDVPIEEYSDPVNSQCPSIRDIDSTPSWCPLLIGYKKIENDDEYNRYCSILEIALDDTRFVSHEKFMTFYHNMVKSIHDYDIRMATKSSI